MFTRSWFLVFAAGMVIGYWFGSHQDYDQTLKTLLRPTTKTWSLFKVMAAGMVIGSGLTKTMTKD